MEIESKRLFQNAIYFDKKNNFQKARTFYILCLRQERRVLNAWLNLGILYSKQKKFRKAIFCYKKAIDLKPNTKSIYNIALEYFVNRLYYSSIFYLQWAIRIDKNFIKGYILLAYSYGIVNKHYYAYVCLRKILNIDATNFTALYTLTLLFFYKKDIKNCKKYFILLQKYYPKESKVEKLKNKIF